MTDPAHTSPRFAASFIPTYSFPSSLLSYMIERDYATILSQGQPIKLKLSNSLPDLRVLVELGGLAIE